MTKYQFENASTEGKNRIVTRAELDSWAVQRDRLPNHILEYKITGPTRKQVHTTVQAELQGRIVRGEQVLAHSRQAFETSFAFSSSSGYSRASFRQVAQRQETASSRARMTDSSDKSKIATRQRNNCPANRSASNIRTIRQDRER